MHGQVRALDERWSEPPSRRPNPRHPASRKQDTDLRLSSL